MQKYSISVIIPVYNCENYIGRCLDSLYLQNFTGSFELVIVDDGSTDNTFKRCSDIVSAGNIPYRLIQQTNQGVSSARNAGISAAKGKYLIFVDGDDALEENALRVLYRLAEEREAELVYGCFRKLDNEGRLLWAYRPLDKCSGQRSSDELLKEMLNGRMLLRLGSFMIKKSCIDSNNIRFYDGCKYGEDIEFIIRCLANVKRAAGTDELIYNYYKNSGSAMDKVDFQRFELVEALKRLETPLKKSGRSGGKHATQLFQYYIPYSILFHVDQLLQRKISVKEITEYLKSKNYYALLQAACGLASDSLTSSDTFSSSDSFASIAGKARLFIYAPALYSLWVRSRALIKKMYRKAKSAAYCLYKPHNNNHYVYFN